MNIRPEATAAATTGQIPLSPTSPGPATPGSSEKPNNNTFPQLNAEALGALVEAVREPLIVCLGRVKSSASGQSSIVPGRVLTANPMACALLNRDLESVQSMPLASLVATASGRPPPQGLVSKCKLHCVGSESVSVECDCRVFSDGKSVPLLFCHLALMDVRGLDGSPATPGTALAVDEGEGEEAAAEGSSAAGAPLTASRAKALAEVQLERLKILLVEDDLFSASAIMELCHQVMRAGMLRVGPLSLSRPFFSPLTLFCLCPTVRV